MKKPMLPSVRLFPNVLSATVASLTTALLTASPSPAIAAPQMPDTPPAAPVAVSVSPSSGFVVVATPSASDNSAPTTAPRYQYVWKHGDAFTTKTVKRDSATALLTAAKAESGDCIVVERAGRRYMITDRYVLDHATEAYAPMTAVTQQMRDFGKQQGDIARKSDGFGQQMRAAGDAMRTVGAQLKAAHDASDTAREAELKVKLQAMGKDLQAQGAQLKPMLEEQLRPMREKLEAMRGKFAAAAQESEDRMTRLLDTAFLRNMAVEIKTDPTSTTPPATVPIEP